MIQQSYRIQDGCYNCKYVFKMVESNRSDEYFCTKDGKKRPNCGSIAMEESFSYHIGERSVINEMNWWNNWTLDRQVEPYGICDSHEYKGE